MTAHTEAARIVEILPELVKDSRFNQMLMLENMLLEFQHHVVEATGDALLNRLNCPPRRLKHVTGRPSCRPHVPSVTLPTIGAQTSSVNGCPAPVCKCGQPMRRSRRLALDINGWVCVGMVYDIVAHDLETARAKHTAPIPVQANDPSSATARPGALSGKETTK